MQGTRAGRGEGRGGGRGAWEWTWGLGGYALAQEALQSRLFWSFSKMIWVDVSAHASTRGVMKPRGVV